jgi:hypothetical protein
MRTALTASVLALLFSASNTAKAWGPEGHAVIADVADAHLTPNAKSIVKTLLGHSTMAGVASWADTVRNQRPQTYNWHFVDIEIENSDYVPTRDCPQTAKGDCALAAIDRFKVVLANTKAPKADRTEALKYLIHFIGDIHQPLHCADHHDRGANDVQVKYCGHGTNLHHAWDSDLISSTGLAEGDYRAHVEAYVDGLSSDEVAKIQSGTPTEWALASHALAVGDSYKVPADKDLCGVYTDENLVVIDQQLANGGLRLAKVLNDILVKK